MTIRSYMEQVTGRPLVILAMVMIAAIIAVGSCVQPGCSYDPEKTDNPFEDAGIGPGDDIEVYGKVSGMGFRNNELYTDIEGVYWNDIAITGPGESLRVYWKELSDIRHGMDIRLSGRLKYYARATNRGEFDSYEFYHHSGSLFQIDDAKLRWKGSNYRIIKYKLWCIKEEMHNRIMELYEDEDGPILSAMILGIKSEIPKEIKEAFQKSGIAHILAISGLHISFLCMLVLNICLKCGINRVVSGIISEIFLWLYVLMVDFSPSACRAAIMFTIYMLSTVIKRSYDMITAVFVALIIILSFNYRLIMEPGLQLSFGAVISIGVVYNRIIDNSKHLKVVLKKRDSSRACGKIYNKVAVGSVNGLITSLCVGIITLPVLLYNYYELAFYSFVLNILVIPLMPIVLVSSIAGIALTAPVGDFGLIFVYLARIILMFYKKSCIFLESTGLGRQNIGKPQMIQIILFYIIIAFALVYNGRVKGIIQIACVIGAWLVISYQNPQGIYMLDVGQGDCFVVIGRDDSTYIFDGGSTSRKNIGENVIIPFLKSNGINRIKGIFVSHPDEDHMNGIVELVNKAGYECLDIDRIYVSEAYENIDKYAAFREPEGQKEAKLTGIKRNMKLTDGDIEISCIYAGNNIDEDANNNSLVLRVVYKSISMLETGDLEIQGERELMDSGMELRADILKIAHHGSNSSTGEEFLGRINPKLALISAGKNNRYGHPHIETIDLLKQKGIPILLTVDTGAVRIDSEDGKINVKMFKK